MMLNKIRLSGQGIELAYQDAGSGPPVVLVMGLGAPADAWAPHVKAWVGSFRCIAVDNRGAGGSSAPSGPYRTAQLADDYAELISRLGLESVRVVGISMGGAIAQELALRHPHLVDRLVLVSSWARLPRHSVETFENLADVRAQVGPATFARLLQLWIWGREWFEKHGAVLAAERASAAPSMTQEAFCAQTAACVTHDTLGRLASIAVPTLVTAGEFDIFTPLSCARELACGIPGARLEVFAGLAHTHHWEALDRFNGLVEEWLQ